MVPSTPLSHLMVVKNNENGAFDYAQAPYGGVDFYLGVILKFKSDTIKLIFFKC